MASAVKAESSKRISQRLAARLPSWCPYTHTGKPAWRHFLESPPATARMCACASVSQHLCFYLRAGTAWGAWRRARTRQRSEDAMRGCGKGCGQGCRQGCQWRRGYLGPQTPWCGGAGGGPACAMRGAASGGAGLSRLGTVCCDLTELRRGCSAQALLRGSGSPCSRSCAPAPALRAPAAVLRAPAQAPRAPGAPRSLTPAATRLPSPRSVFIGFQCKCNSKTVILRH